MMSRLKILSLAGTVILGGLFLSVLLRPEPSIELPLINLVPSEDPLHSAVLVKDAPILTGEIRSDISGQYILRGTAVIPAGAKIKIENATILAERDAKMIIQGELSVSNSTFSSNQIHPTRKYWHGIVAEGDGKLNLDKTEIKDATAGITCSEKSQTSIRNSKLAENTVGIVSLPSAGCEISNSEISLGRVGIQVLGGNPQINNSTFSQLYDGLRVYSGEPNIINSKFDRIENEQVWQKI